MQTLYTHNLSTHEGRSMLLSFILREARVFSCEFR
jgi:hypothetical protein